MFSTKGAAIQYGWWQWYGASVDQSLEVLVAVAMCGCPVTASDATASDAAVVRHRAGCEQWARAQILASALEEYFAMETSAKLHHRGSSCRHDAQSRITVVVCFLARRCTSEST